MKKKLHLKKVHTSIALLCICCIILFTSCNKNESNVPVVRGATFTADVNGVSSTGADFLDFSYSTSNDEFLETPYTEIHIAGSNALLAVMIANPTAKQFSLGASNAEAGVLLTLGGTLYEATNTAILVITEATSTKLIGTISGTFSNVNTGANIQVTKISFTAQF